VRTIEAQKPKALLQIQKIDSMITLLQIQKIDSMINGVNGSAKTVPKAVIKSTMEEFSSNLQEVLTGLINNKNLFEGRNDFKIYANAVILEPPEAYVAAKITDNNRKKIKAFIVSKRESIKINEIGKFLDFKKAVNKSIEKVIDSNVLLDKFINESYNIRQLYLKIAAEITDDLSKTFRVLTNPEKKSLSVNIKKIVGEVLSIKLVAPNTSTKPEVAGGTYYEHEPNGVGTFPDYVFHFGTVENDDAKNIRSMFDVPKKISKVKFEAKTDARIVGKQRSPKTFLENLKDKEIFKKLQGLKIKGTIELSFEELMDILQADGLVIDKYTYYLNAAGASSKTQVRKIKWLPGFAPFKVKRTSPGQMAITGKGSNATLFKIEIGSVAHSQGAFKVPEEEEAEGVENKLSNLLMEVKNA